MAIKFNDIAPRLSADGTRAVFVSGRAAADGTAVYRAYRVDWPAGGAPSDPVRVTTDDKLGSERVAAISADGKWAALIATTDGQTDLYLQSLVAGEAGGEGAPTLVRLTDDAADEIAPEFSPDAKLLAWGQRTASGSAAYVLELGDGSEAATRAPVQTKAAGTADAALTQVLWLPATNGAYQLVTVEQRALGRMGLAVRSFAAAAEAAAAEPVRWSADILPVDSVRAAAGGTVVLTASQVLATARREAERTGDFTPEAGATTARTRLLSEVSVATSDAVKPFGSALGYGVLGLGLSTDGSTGVALARAFYRCKDDGNDLYGSSLNVLGLGDNQVVPLAPRLTSRDPAALAFDAASGLCDRGGAAGKGRVDDKIYEVAINGGATLAAFRLLYVSRFTARFDANCVLKTGDPEIYGLSAEGGSKSIYPVSKNAAPIADAPRGDQPACAL